MKPSAATGLANERLAELLRLVGWRPEAFARRINIALAECRSTRRVHEQTPYKWLARGEVPHGEVPELVVDILSRALDVDLDYEDVWHTDRQRPRLPMHADHAMDLRWDGRGLLSLLGGSVPTRRTVFAVAGAALTGPAWNALRRPAPGLVSAHGGRVSEPLLQMIEAVVAQAQQLDDQQGGAARDFVRDQFNAVARLLRLGAYDTAGGRRLAAALAQLAQTAGFMAFDAFEDGQAQRWYLIALRAAHAADDRSLAASVLALMSNQAADRGHALDALQLASAAQEAAADAPTAVRSLVNARSGLAHAAAGDLAGFTRMRDATRGLLTTSPDRPLPRWASYVDGAELDAITGRGLVVLADHLPARRKQLLRQATPLLHTRAHSDAAGPARRSALRHGAWLGLAHAAAGDLDQAVTAARRALTHVPAVASVRSVALLHRLHDELSPARDRRVRELLRDLRRLPRRS